MDSGNTVFDYGVEKDAVPGVQNILLVVHLKLEYTLKYKDELFPLVAVDLVLQLFRAHGYKHRLHLLVGHLHSQGQNGITAFGGYRRTLLFRGGNKHTVPAVSFGNQAGNVGMKGGCNLYKRRHRGNHLASLYLGEKALGKAAVVRHVLQGPVLQFSQFANVSADGLGIREFVSVVQSAFLIRGVPDRMIEKKQSLCNPVECCIRMTFSLTRGICLSMILKDFQVKGVIISYEGKA